MNRQDRGRATTGTVLVVLGLLFLAAQIFNFSFFGMLWPLLVLVPGAIFVYLAYTGGKDQVGFAVPGAIVGGTGLMLLYQNLTGHWESWAYAWALYPVFLGLALRFMGNRTGDAGQLSSGQGLVRLGGILFIVFAVFFELFIFRGGSLLSRWIVPALLIGLGGWLLLRPKTAPAPMKRKTVEIPSSVEEKPKKVSSAAAIPDELQRKIDEALAEEDQPADTPRPTGA